MFSLNGILKKSGSVGQWETQQFIGMALGGKKAKYQTLDLISNGFL